MRKVNRGFTLLELIIVIIILGILATLAFTQYTRMIERSRGAEARTTLGIIRTQAAAFYMEHGNTLTGITNADVGIPDGIPAIGACAPTNYFGYGVVGAGTVLTATATRCDASGKAPNVATAQVASLVLTSDLAAGTDNWAGPY